MSLARTALSETVRITGVRGADSIAFRLMEMGLVEGAHVEVLRCAPLGDPLHVRLGDYELSLRKREAELVEVAAL